MECSCPWGSVPKLLVNKFGRDNLSSEIGRTVQQEVRARGEKIVHYEYMALAKQNYVLREAMLLGFEQCAPYMYVCVYIYIYICIHIHMCVYIYIYTHM